jgi:hypothetical protein
MTLEQRQERLRTLGLGARPRLYGKSKRVCCHLGLNMHLAPANPLC